jgi:hypothetical protein
VRRHPQWALHATYWLMLVVLWASTPAAGLWRAVVYGLALLYPVVIWRCAYLVLAGQHGRMKGTGITDHLFYLWPAYGGSNTPYGKGLANLSQNEARTTEELARSQLAGINFCCWPRAGGCGGHRAALVTHLRRMDFFQPDLDLEHRWWCPFPETGGFFPGPVPSGMSWHQLLEAIEHQDS